MSRYKLTIIPRDQFTADIKKRSERNLIDTIENLVTFEGSMLLIIEPSLDPPSKAYEIVRGLEEWDTTQVLNEQVIDFVNDIITGRRSYPKTKVIHDE